MSSANRGRERNKDDLYETSHWLIEAYIPDIITRFDLQGIDRPVIWEPCAGNGRVARVLKERIPYAKIVTSDLQEYPGLDFQADFLELDPIRHDKFDLIISNPPFCKAEEIIQHAFGFLSEHGTVDMLERMNFMGSKQRERWLSVHVPDVAVSPRRASFLPTKGADSIEYGWMSWPLKDRRTGLLTYLDTMTCDTCHQVHYEKICQTCDYGFCKKHFPSHECKLFGSPFLWGCRNHPDRAMKSACKEKIPGENGKKQICGQPLCEECWTTHAHAA